MKRLSVIVILSLVLSACSTAAEIGERFTKPRPYGLAETPEGTAMFKRGWEDGCETGLVTYGNDRYKLAYDFKQDHTLVLNDEYYRAWKDAYTYCRWYVFNWVRPAR